MLTPTVFRRRRHALTERVQGPILLLGNGVRARNLPGYGVPFRQDSTFLYFTGCDLPDAAALIEGERCTLFLPEPYEEQALWEGEPEPTEALRERFGVDAVKAPGDLKPLPASTLAIPDENRNALGTALTGLPLAFGRHHGSEALVAAVIELRLRKDAEGIEEMKEAGRVSRLAHEAVIRATRPGGHERTLAALFRAVLAAHGCTEGYHAILTQSGEVLHNHHHDQPLQAGRLLLLDAGGEVPSGFGVDITRTWPVSGRFTPRQRAVYDAVLDSQLAAVAACTVGTRYRDIHDLGSRILARFLADEGLLLCDPDTSVETAAHGLFFPHGIGHHLGMDVHDLENFGDRPSYPPGQGRSKLFGTRNLRLDLPLEAGFVVTIEPGLYFVPAILNDPALRERYKGLVDFDRAQEWLGFGGIRIEDDVHVTPDGPELLTDVPKTAQAMEELAGSGPFPEGLFAL